MSSRDDMVITPTLSRHQRASAPTRAREERRLASAKRRGGALRRLRQARAIRKARKNALTKRARVRASGFARGASARLGARVLGNPVGLVVGALIVVGVVTLRLVSGRPLEGLGETLNRKFLGVMDDEARAKMATRSQLQGNANLMRIAGIEGGINSQIREVSDDLFELNRREELGASLLREEFPANNIVDMLILRARDAIRNAWFNGNGDSNAQLAMELIGAGLSALSTVDVSGMAAGLPSGGTARKVLRAR